MKSAETIGVVQVGATGAVAETFRDFVSQSEFFELEAIATVSHTELHGKKLGETRLKFPPSLADVPITGVVTAIDNADAPLFFSGMRPDMAARYERRMAAAGHLVVTNSSANRMEPDVALVSPFVNPHHIDELFGNPEEGVEGIKVPEAKMIAGGNCLVDIALPTIAVIRNGIGIKSMSVETWQGWSGAGASEVPDGVGNSTQPIKGDEAEKIRTEPNKFLGVSIARPADILIGAEPKNVRRAPWLNGHKAEITLILDRETSKQEVEDLLRNFKAPDEINAARAVLRSISHAGGDKWPRRHEPIRPVKLEHGDLVRTRITPHRLDRLQPMRTRAHVLKFDPEDPARIVIEVSGHNLWLGAVGGNMLNAAYAHIKGYLRPQ